MNRRRVLIVAKWSAILFAWSCWILFVPLIVLGNWKLAFGLVVVSLVPYIVYTKLLCTFLSPDGDDRPQVKCSHNSEDFAKKSPEKMDMRSR